MPRKLIVAIFAILPFVGTYADLKVDKMMKYSQEVQPEISDHYQFSTYYSNNKHAYNLKGFEMGKAPGPIRDFKINPAGYSYAMIAGKDGKTNLFIAKINSKEEPLRANNLKAPTAICYSPDSRQIMVADDNYIKILDSKTLEEQSRFSIGNEKPSALSRSNNGYFIAASYPTHIDVYNLQLGELRHSFPTTQNSSVAFTESSDKVGILTPHGNLTLYNTIDFLQDATFPGLADQTQSLFFHPNDNYAGFIADGNRIQFVNLTSPNDRPSISEPGVQDARFVLDGRNNLYLTSIVGNNIRYRQVSGFAVNYASLINQRVDDLMAEWTKMRPGETELEYRERVNAESIKAQRILFANQVSSELALTAGLGKFSDIKLGRYNPDNGILSIILDHNIEIFIQVPKEDMPGFGDGNNLIFSNHIYTLQPDNTFKLNYLSVYNPTNNKNYIYDNLAGQDIAFLNLDDSFVSLDLIMQSSREDIKLKSIKDRIMDHAKALNKLSDNTTINVESRIEQSVDASGNRIRNNIVDFAYEVSAEGSATEDFAPGHYKVEDSNAAITMIEIIKLALSDEDISKYLIPGKKLTINITGQADASPIRGSIAYDGSLGTYTDEPCKVNGFLTTLSVNKTGGIKTNEQLGFMRAKGVERKIIDLIPELASMDLNYEHNIEVAKEEGAQFRRIAVSLIFIDAL